MLVIIWSVDAQSRLRRSGDYRGEWRIIMFYTYRLCNDKEEVQVQGDKLLIHYECSLAVLK